MATEARLEEHVVMHRTISAQMELFFRHNGIIAPEGLGHMGHQGNQNVNDIGVI